MCLDLGEVLNWFGNICRLHFFCKPICKFEILITLKYLDTSLCLEMILGSYRNKRGLKWLSFGLGEML